MISFLSNLLFAVSSFTTKSKSKKLNMQKKKIHRILFSLNTLAVQISCKRNIVNEKRTNNPIMIMS